MTDDYDKRLLCTFTSVWFNPDLLTADFKFFEGYGIPDCRNLEEYMEFISSLPLQVIQRNKHSRVWLYIIFSSCRTFLRCLVCTPMMVSRRSRRPRTTGPAAVMD